MADAVPALDHGADSILQGEHVPEAEPAVSPERGLWLSVIATAWNDAFIASDAWLRNSDRRRACEPELIRNESRRWLTLDFGDWKQDREHVCSLAGVDADVIRQAARKKLAEIKAGEAATAEIISLDAAFARLLDSESELTPAEIDSALAELATLEVAA